MLDSGSQLESRQIDEWRVTERTDTQAADAASRGWPMQVQAVDDKCAKRKRREKIRLNGSWKRGLGMEIGMMPGLPEPWSCGHTRCKYVNRSKVLVSMHARLLARSLGEVAE